MNRKSILAGAVLLSGFLMASHADAFSFFTCNGNPVVWGSPFQLVQNTFSIPFGTPPESSLDNAIGRDAVEYIERSDAVRIIRIASSLWPSATLH